MSFDPDPTTQTAEEIRQRIKAAGRKPNRRHGRRTVTYLPYEDHKHIVIPRGPGAAGRFGIVDSANVEALANRCKCWGVELRGRTYYLRCTDGPAKGRYLHQEVMGRCPRGLSIDHADGHGNNNVTENLSFKDATQQANNRRRPKLSPIGSRVPDGWCAHCGTDTMNLRVDNRGKLACAKCWPVVVAKQKWAATRNARRFSGRRGRR